MRKKLLLLALSLTALTGALGRAQAGGTHACPICTTYSDGSQCCRSCLCNDQGFQIACTQNICPPYH
jgi:hypothetical protein